MKKMMFTLAVLCSQSIYAGEFLLLNITNEVDKEVTKFILVTDQDNEDVQAFYKSTFKATGQIISKVKISVNQIAATTGIVLDKRDNRDIVVLKSDNFASHNGGDLEVDTLYNGITGSRKSYMLDLQRHGQSWKIERDGKVISKMHLISKKRLGKLVGIKEIKTY